MAWLVDNWQVLVGLAGSLLGTGGLLALLRYRHIEEPQAESELRAKEAENYQRMLETQAKQGTLIGELSAKLDDEREKRRELEDRLDELENKLAIKDRTISIFSRGVAKLHKQIRDLGHEPVWSYEG
jgi:septal ring factor EnvC (AmiA/AmiB activator)